MLNEVPSFARALDIGDHRARCPQCGRNDRDETLSITVESRTTGVFNCHRCHYADNWRESEPDRGRIEAERAARAAATAERARAIYDGAGPADPAHAYLNAKRIAAPSWLRQERNLLLIPVRAADGALVNLQTIDPDGVKRFLYGGAKKGCYMGVGRPAPGDRAIFIAEGFATAASVHRASGCACAIAFDAGNLEPVARVLRAKYPERTIIIAADDDWQTDGNPGAMYAARAARAIGGLIAMPQGWPATRATSDTDFNDLARATDDATVALALYGAHAPPAEEPAPPPAAPEPPPSRPRRPIGEEWMQPMDLWQHDWTPTLDVALLPDSIAAWATESAELMGADPALLGMSALAVCAGAASDQHRIQPKRHDPTWTERSRLWVMIVGTPSTKKSPAMSKAVKPLHGIEGRLRELFNRQLGEYNNATEQHRAARRRRTANAPSEPEPAPPQKPKQRRVLVDDATIEKIAHILQDNPHGVLSIQSELASWFGGMDAYRSTQSTLSRDRAAWLKLYDGGPHYVDRVREEGSFFVQNFSSCILGGVQPEVIKKVKGNEDDGLMQRFIPVFVRNATADVDRPANMDVLNRYTEIVDQIFMTRPDEAHIRLSDEAHDIRDELERRVDIWCGIAPEPSFEYHFGKLRGLFVRLLLVYHMIESAERGEHPTASTVSGATAHKVFKLVNSYIVPSIMRFYTATVEADKRIAKMALALLAANVPVITRARLSRFMRRAWGNLSRNERSEALDVLVTYGWIRVAPGARIYDGAPSKYEVNPAIFERFAGVRDAEVERRREVRRLIRGEADAGGDAPADAPADHGD